MKKFSLLIFLSFSLTALFGQIEGTWLLAPQAGALGVGPALGDISYWSNNETDITTRACLFDDKFVFSDDGTFMNVQDGDTWVEIWQGAADDGCAAPVAPHDGSNAATWSFDEMAGTVTITGEGAHLGIAKVINGGELAAPADAPASITYPVVFSNEGNTVTIDIDAGTGLVWHFVLVKEGTVVVEPPSDGELTGTWKISPVAGALGVGPAVGDISYWSNNEADITTRACLFDDKFVFSDDGTFMNVQDGDTWVEIWQGAAADGCAAPVAPHDGSNAATWSFDEMASTVTITGVGAHLGLAKVINGGELAAPADAPASITYPVVFSNEGNTVTIDIATGTDLFWRFVLVKEGTVEPPVEVDFEGTWILAPEAGTLGVGPGLGDVSYWSNSEADITTRDCLFDDKFTFDENGTFSNVQDNDTWLEPWQGVTAEGCGNPVAPHDGSNAATWSYNETNSTVTITGEGAHLGLAKVINGAELDGTIAVPASITYPVVFTDGGDRMTIDIEAGGVYWHFVMIRDESTPVVEVVENLFNFYPNPATSEIRVNSVKQMDQLIIRDITGRILMVRTNPDINETMNISELPRGMYLLEAKSDNQVSIQKFIVE